MPNENQQGVGTDVGRAKVSNKDDLVFQEICIDGPYIDTSWAAEITREMLLDTELTLEERAVLSLMMIFTDDTDLTDNKFRKELPIGELQEEMLKYAGLGKRELDYFLEKIANAGWISVEKDLDNMFSGQNIYVIVHKKWCRKEEKEILDNSFRQQGGKNE